MKQKLFMVVDDDSVEAFSIGGVLQSHSRDKGMTLRVFTDGDEAITFVNACERNNIGGAIVDLWMVDKASGRENSSKGQELITAISDRHPDAKVVVLSAHLDEQARDSFKRLKVASFRKPASVVEVFEAATDDKSSI